ncbi:polyheme membrane-associated cytochrome C [Aestuariibius sp. 2305UL40-4]|uniref:polyheme membrane-associated cytochrome C n=1 Tax=Aestuariibius violaceus TaxID=3234132 RepID=UPI00345E3A42
MRRFPAAGSSIATVLALILSLPAAAQEPTIEEITEAWLASPHADGSSGAFTHWDEDGEIPGTCAVCHSTTGVTDYLSGPMSPVGRIDHAVALGEVVECSACHSDAAEALVSVPFQSGAMIDTFGSSAVCAVCHQGRASTVSVANAVNGMDEDAVSADLQFINVHYAPSAATLMGSAVRGGFEYEGQAYNGPFTHVPQFAQCVDCHRPHSLEVVSIDNCSTCHQGVDEFTDIRFSRVDFDGDGDVAEGIADPIATLHDRLGEAIGLYAADVAGTPIIYADAYPYFFIDTDGDGAVSDGEAAFPNRYQTWTPRLLQAAYNYQFVEKDSAAHIHNPHYALQLLHDSLSSLSEQVEVDMEGLVRP